MEKDIKQILLTEEQIRTRVKQLAKEIESDYENEINCVIVLTGSVIFFSDLVREIKNKIIFHAVKVSSYQNDKSTGQLDYQLDIKDDIKDKDILLIEDIVDTGNTISKLKAHLEKRGARVKIAALLDKPSRRTVEVNIDYKGFEIPDYFVVGYGLDYNQHYRNLHYIGVLKEEVYQKLKNDN